MRIVIGAFFPKRGYEIRHRGLVFLKGVMRFVIGSCFPKRVMRFVIGAFFPKGIMRFVIGSCFPKRGYEICHRGFFF